MPHPRGRPASAAIALAAAFVLACAAPGRTAPAEQDPSAQSAPRGRLPSGLDISSQVDRSEITIGDRILYEIKVVYPAEGRVELPSVLGNLGSFEVKDYQASDPKPAGNLVIQTWRLTLSTYTVGDYMIPPQVVVYLPPGAVMPALPGAPADSEQEAAPPPGAPQPLVLNTQPIGIKVVRTSPETVQDIADIAPLAAPPRSVPWLPLGLAAGLLAALGAWLLWRRRKRTASAAAEAPPLPPYEEAMARLADLNPGSLIRQNRARELGFILSEVLRRYVSRRFEVDALESTTTEFLALVPRLPVTSAHRQWMVRFCEDTDLVKFAGAPLLESDGADLVDGLKKFLEQTRPRETEAGTGTAKPAPAAGPGRSVAGKAGPTPSTSPPRSSSPSAPTRKAGEP